MPQYEVHKLFPTPLFVYDDLTTTEEERNFVYNQEWYRVGADNGWLTKNHYLLNEPVLKSLKEKIQNVFEIYLHEILKVPKEMGCRITNSWTVKHSPDDWAQQHIHTNSVFSGVYYIDTNEDAGDINFHRQEHDISILPLTTRPGKFDELNEFNGEQYKVLARNNKCIIFPSSLMHSVEQNKSKRDRYCIAFNFFPTGTWGRDEFELIL
jgi:uncharacterized protein (TIGR02466 family)